MSLVRILVVDEVEGWRQLATSVLRAEPSFEVICEVSDGLKAVKLTARVQPDVVLLNIGLPGPSGIVAAGWIRKLAPDARIVFVCEDFDVAMVKATQHLGAWGYFLKSDTAQELVAAIHSVVRGEKFISSSLAGHNFLDWE